MTKSVARCLIDQQHLNQTELCKSFVREYLHDPNRGYGEAIVTVFRKLRQNRFRDVHGPAAEQFGGSGSFGNGGAMRIAPVALFCHRRPVEELIEMVEQATLVTHTHPLGVHGSILQALAIEAALACDPNQPLDSLRFVRTLREQIDRVESADEDGCDRRTDGHSVQTHHAITLSFCLLSDWVWNRPSRTRCKCIKSNTFWTSSRPNRKW